MTSTMTSPPSSPTSTLRRAGRGLLDILTGPHGVDRYAELLDPTLASDRHLAEVVATQPETDDTVTLTLTPPKGWASGQLPRPRHGQAVNLTVEVDGVRHTRSFSVASLTPNRWTVTVRENPGGTVSPFLVHRARPGMFVEVGAPFGEMVLPRDAGADAGLLLVSGGSGITPVMAMVRELRRAGRLARPGSRLAASPGVLPQVTFLHYARRPEELIFATELAELGDAFVNLDVVVVHTAPDAPDGNDRGLRGHFRREHVAALRHDVDAARTFVCGPRGLAEAVRGWISDEARLTCEFFSPPAITSGGDHAEGTLRFAPGDVQVATDGRSILEQAEDAGLSPEHGCRMGICHSCVQTVTAGSVRDLLTGEVRTATDAAPVEAQLCISAADGDCTVAL
jgi:ferredoxin-NADP reductase